MPAMRLPALRLTVAAGLFGLMGSTAHAQNCPFNATFDRCMAAYNTMHMDQNAMARQPDQRRFEAPSGDTTPVTKDSAEAVARLLTDPATRAQYELYVGQGGREGFKRFAAVFLATHGFRYGYLGARSSWPETENKTVGTRPWSPLAFDLDCELIRERRAAPRTAYSWSLEVSPPAVARSSGTSSASHSRISMDLVSGQWCENGCIYRTGRYKTSASGTLALLTPNTVASMKSSDNPEWRDEFNMIWDWRTGAFSAVGGTTYHIQPARSSGWSVRGHCQTVAFTGVPPAGTTEEP